MRASIGVFLIPRQGIQGFPAGVWLFLPSASAGILPLRLRGEPKEVPCLCRQLPCELHGLIPRDLLNGALVAAPLGIRGVVSHEAPPLLLGHLVSPDPEAAQADLVRRLLAVGAAGHPVTASHLK